jgi:hypothetical protein
VPRVSDTSLRRLGCALPHGARAVILSASGQLNSTQRACHRPRAGDSARLNLSPRIPYALHDVTGFAAGLRDRLECHQRRSRQGRRPRSGQEDRHERHPRLAARARHVPDHAPGANRLRHGQERRRASRERRAAQVRGYETTLEEIKARIAKTLAFLKTLDKAAMDASSDREITFPLGADKGQMKGADYLNHFVLPNFHFHLTTAYGLIRSCGVDIGKRDFIGSIPLKMI